MLASMPANHTSALVRTTTTSTRWSRRAMATSWRWSIPTRCASGRRSSASCNWPPAPTTATPTHAHTAAAAMTTHAAETPTAEEPSIEMANVSSTQASSTLMPTSVAAAGAKAPPRKVKNPSWTASPARSGDRRFAIWPETSACRQWPYAGRLGPNKAAQRAALASSTVASGMRARSPSERSGTRASDHILLRELRANAQ